MRAIFCGTPPAAVAYLEALCRAGHEIAAVVTQPDRPGRRGRDPVPGPVKRAAEGLGLPCLQPERLQEAAGQLEGCGADVAIVVAYGQMLPSEVLCCPRLGCLNVHYSLLPKLRGAAPVQRALMQNLRTTGVTVQRMAADLDAGDIVQQQAVRIAPDDNQESLLARLTEVGVRLVVRLLAAHPQGGWASQPQDQDVVTWAPSLAKAEGEVDWTRPAEEVAALVRGLGPSPGAYTTFRGARLRLLAAAVRRFLTVPGGAPGQMEELAGQRLGVLCGVGGVELTTVQPDSRRSMTGAEFVRGARLRAGELCGRLPARCSAGSTQHG